MIEEPKKAEDETLSGTYTVGELGAAPTPNWPTNILHRENVPPSMPSQWRIQNYRKDGEKLYSENFEIGTHVW